MQVTPQQSRERLLAIVSHLRKPQAELHNTEFNFCCITKKIDCGTAGCAIGEMPIVFPLDFQYIPTTDGRTPVKRKDSTVMQLEGDLQNFFGLCGSHLYALFMPNSFSRFSTSVLTQNGILSLPDKATKEQVADNIQRYVDAFLPEQSPSTDDSNGLPA